MKKYLRHIDIGMKDILHKYYVVFNGKVLRLCQMARAGKDGIVCVYVPKSCWPEEMLYPQDGFVPRVMLRGNVKIVSVAHAHEICKDVNDLVDLKKEMDEKYLFDREKILKSHATAQEKWDAFERLKIEVS